MARVSGIYVIRCTETDEVYVGSAVDTARRLMDHRRHLAQGVHVNRRLQAAWARWGAEAFDFTVVQEAAPEALLAAERDWMLRLHALEAGHGFNAIAARRAHRAVRRPWRLEWTSDPCIRELVRCAQTLAATSDKGDTAERFFAPLDAGERGELLRLLAKVRRGADEGDVGHTDTP